MNSVPVQTSHFETCCGQSESGSKGSSENNAPLFSPILDAGPITHFPRLDIHQIALLSEVQDFLPLTGVVSSYKPALDPWLESAVSNSSRTILSQSKHSGSEIFEKHTKSRYEDKYYVLLQLS